MRLSYLSNNKLIIKNIVGSMVDFINTYQLKDKNLWKQFVQIFRDKSDKNDNGWRCEYFGKMMRGACLIYQVNKDPELYRTLESAVLDLLTTQDSLGRFTSYINEFQGWDMWGRKYVISSLCYFYDICKDEQLKEKVKKSLCKHADYIVNHIGNDKNQIDILDTSEMWGGLNSASICEAFIHLYKITKFNRYLDFAKYIIETGGCKNGNLVALARENKIYPYEYPVVKAYEMMSFFEGLLEYYDVTGNVEYLNIFTNFISKVRESDITAIGCAGCTHELFDHSYMRQTEKGEIFMQETCVAVTWMRILSKYYLLTGESWCIDEIEKSGLNDLLGAINDKNNLCYSYYDKKYVNWLPFDSYSPLYMSRRGIAVGGIKNLPNGDYYGCCACIGSAGIGVLALDAVTFENELPVINIYEDLTIKDVLNISGDFYRTGKCLIKLENKLGVKLRIPSYVEKMIINGSVVNQHDGYVLINNLKEINIECLFKFQKTILNGKCLFTFGPFVLGQDEQISNIVTVNKNENIIAMLKTKNSEICRYKIDKGIFVDYAHIGKIWKNDKNITIWNDIK